MSARPSMIELLAANDDKPAVRILSGNSLLAFAPQRWLVKPLLPAGRVVLVGPSGTGKTFVALHVALRHAAAGGEVLYIYAEGQNSLGRRIRAALVGLWLDAPPASFHVIPHALVIGETEAASLAEVVPEIKRRSDGPSLSSSWTRSPRT